MPLPPGFKVVEPEAAGKLPPGFRVVESAPQGRSLSGFTNNLARSGGEFAGGLASAVMHPVQTGKALGSAALGAAQLAIPGEQGMEKYARAFGQMYADRYGSFEKAVDTFYNDPVGAMADLSMVMGGAGGALRGATAVTKAAGATRAASGLGRLATGATKLGRAADPMVNAAKAVTGPVKFLGEKVGLGTLNPVRLHQSALKPYRKASQREPFELMKRLSDTMADEGIDVNVDGLIRQADLIEDINAKIADIVEVGSASKGAILDPNRVAQAIEGLKRTKFYRGMPKAERDAAYGRIDAFKELFLSEFPEIKGGTKGQRIGMTARRAQEMKQTKYRQIRRMNKNAYDKVIDDISLDTNKALARGLKDELARNFDELKHLNARESRLLELEPYLEQALWRITKREMTGIGTSLAVGAAHAATGSRGAAVAVGTLRHLFERPGFKSALARIIRTHQKSPGWKYSTARGAAKGLGLVARPKALTAYERIDAYYKFLVTADDQLNPKPAAPQAPSGLGQRVRPGQPARSQGLSTPLGMP